MLNFDFLQNCLRIVSTGHFQNIFSKKIFLMLYYINWPNFIVWLSLLLEVLGNMCFAIISFPGCDVINLKINLIFLVKPFLYMTEKSRKKSKYLENKKSSSGETESVFQHFKWLSVTTSCVRPESAPLSLTKINSVQQRMLIFSKPFFPNIYKQLHFCNASVALINQKKKKNILLSLWKYFVLRNLDIFWCFFETL